MLEPVYTKPFRKERKLMGKRGWDIDKLTEVLDMIVNEQPLPPERVRTIGIHADCSD